MTAPLLASTAPSGILEMEMLSVSEPSVSVSAGEISSGMAESSLPVAPDMTSVGVSASPVTSTSMEPETVLVAPPSVSVVVTLTPSVKSALLSSGGVTVRPSRSSAPSVQVPSPLSVPAESVAPAGTPDTVTETVSEPSVSSCVTSMERLMALSSVPAASATSRVEPATSSSIAPTLTVSVPLLVAVSPPSNSVAVEVTVKSKEPLKSSGGVMVRPASCDVSTSATPSVTVIASPPDISTAPSGMSEMVTVVVPAG